MSPSTLASSSDESESPADDLARLRRQNDHLESLLSSVPDMMCEMDDEGRYLSIRAPRAELLVAPPEALIGRRVREVSPGPVADQVEAALAEAATHGHSLGRHYALDRPEGRRWFELSIRRHLRFWQSSPHYVCFIRDITHRKAAEFALAAAHAQATRDRESAEQASALKSRLLAFASHDLKSPLSSLHATCQLLDEVADDPAEIRGLARLMAGEARRMTRLVHDFLDRSALDGGGLRLEKRPVDLPSLAAGVLGEHRASAEMKRHVLSLLPPSIHPDPVLADPARIEQILANLIENAVKYTPSGGRITLAFGETPAAVWCAVEDNGPGLTAADLARIFQPYEKLSARPTGGESSHGLGLVLARELARLHGGDLVAGNVSGAGARFLLTLPRA
jgi:PAS domain S-box-containing protein